MLDIIYTKKLFKIALFEFMLLLKNKNIGPVIKNNLFGWFT